MKWADELTTMVNLNMIDVIRSGF